MRARVAIPFLLATFLLGSATAARAGIAVTLTAPQQTYIAGQNNTFTFNVGLTNSGLEWVDRLEFVFPAAVTIVSGTPPSGSGGCGTNIGVQSICSPSISWTKLGIPCTGAFAPTGCGTYTSGDFTFTVTASVPADFSGPLVVTLNSSGDGFGSPPHTDTDTITFGLLVIPTASVWGLGALALLLAGTAFVALRRVA